MAYSYDALNRLSEVNDPHAGITAYTYDDVGNLHSFIYPNGVATVYDYSSLNRLTNMSVVHGLSTIANYAYGLMESGDRVSAVETIQRDPMAQPTTLTRLYQYDRTYRLTNETIGGTSYATPATLDYSYDRVGNRLQFASTEPGIVSSLYSYDANDRLLSDTYDNNGNTLTSPSFGMSQPDQYDFENRLVRRADNGKTVLIVYDGDGNRVKKTVTTSTNTVTTWFLVDMVNPTGYAQVLEEITTDTANPQLATPQVTRIYSYGHDLISQQQFVGSGWDLSFFGSDGHGNTRFLTDVNGFVTDTYDYDAFGNLIARTGSTPNNYLFTGEQYDPDFGLYFLRARYQNTQTGRFWTMDSFEGFDNDPESLHKYLYVHNDPINSADPSGRSRLMTTVVAVATAAIVGTVLYVKLRRPIARGFRLLKSDPLDSENRTEFVDTLKAIRPLLGGGAKEKVDLLIDAVEDGTIHIRVMDSTGMAAHAIFDKNTMYIGHEALQENGAIVGTLLIFAEFQHMPQSNDPRPDGDPVITFELNEVRAALIGTNPKLEEILNRYEHGGH